MSFYPTIEHARTAEEASPAQQNTMSGSKAVLKAINDAVRQQKFDDVISKAQDFLKKEPKNYQA